MGKLVIGKSGEIGKHRGMSAIAEKNANAGKQEIGRYVEFGEWGGSRNRRMMEKRRTRETRKSANTGNPGKGECSEFGEGRESEIGGCAEIMKSVDAGK